MLFIVNPIAGQGAAERAIPQIDGLAKVSQFDYKMVVTEHPGHAIELSQQAAIDRYKYVIAVGGDGTSNEVLNGLMQAWDRGYRETVMGVIGVGRGNDFAYGFGILPGLDHGFAIIQNNNVRPMDVGIITGGNYPSGRYFGNGVGIGFDAVVGFQAAKLVHLHGFLNYIVAALRTIFLYFHAPKVRIEYDGESITQAALMVSIMNGRRMGGGFMMAPHASPNDGKLDMCIASQVSRMGILGLIPKFMKGTQSSSPHIKFLAGSRIIVTAIEGSLPVHADGETICEEGREIRVGLIPHPLGILGG
jgi:YegS/Rv2252/BmrU family lipid kinase